MQFSDVFPSVDETFWKLYSETRRAYNVYSDEFMVSIEHFLRQLCRTRERQSSICIVTTKGHNKEQEKRMVLVNWYTFPCISILVSLMYKLNIAKLHIIIVKISENC